MKPVSFMDPRLPALFWNKVIPEPNSGCWLWTALTDRKGYGRASGRGTNAHAHRLAYVTLVGPIAVGLVIDHLCRTRCCVNPHHMEPVTIAENTRRGISSVVARQQAASVIACPAGHLYTAKNTRRILQSDGYVHRHCRTCDRAGMRAWRARRKAA